jgi:SAM-dependent methyltransferase
MIGFILRCYLWLHEWIHKRVISRLGRRIYGLHPKEVIGRRHESFAKHVCRDDIVLDVACGSGSVLYHISGIIKNGFGIDYSDKQIELCKKFSAADNISFKKADVLDIDYKQAKKDMNYNVAIFSHFLEHISDVTGFLKKVDAERILICVPCYDHWYRILMMDMGLDIRTDRSHVKEYTHKELIDEVTKAGYEITVIEYNTDGDIFCSAKKIKKEV